MPPKGEGSVSFTYQNLYVRDHLDSKGARLDRGQIRTSTETLSFEYGLANRLALDSDLAYIASKYIGQAPHGPPDNGSYHPTFQDARIGLRYNLLKNPLVLTPFIGVVVPTHDYDPRGHSAVGRGLHEFQVGVNAGRQLGPVLPDVYVHARYSYAIVERVSGLNLNRSNADWEVGYFATESFAFRFLAGWQRTHGGFDLPEDVHSPGDFDIHDRVARANYLRLGGGVTFSVSRSFDIHTAYVTTVSGRNTHAARGLAIGVSWRFSTGLASAQLPVNTSEKKLPASVQEIY